MNAQPSSLSPPYNADAVREAFRVGDRKVRQAMLSSLQPEEIEFAGIRMFVDPRDNYTDQRIWLDGQPPEMASLMALVEMVEGKRALVLDIGANCGAYAVPLGLAVGEGSAVIAFEPNPVMQKRLHHNIALNDLVDVVHVEGCALGAEAGHGTLNLKHDNYGQASLKPIRPRLRAGGIDVPIRPLMDYVDPAQTWDITLLKIDVEGAEEATLCPMLETGNWLPDVMLVETRHAAEWGVDLIALIKAAGFAVMLEVEGNTLFVHEGAHR